MINDMSLPVSNSTLFLTILTMVGLPFFIRGSVKDRTEELEIKTSETEEVLLPKLQTYFEERAYKAIAVDKDNNQVTFQGFVQPSWFMAIFLTFITLLGLFSLALVLVQLYPAIGNIFWLLLILSPVSGIFYWKNAARLEKVLLRIETEFNGQDSYKLITLIGHRDELTQLRKNLSFKLVK